MKNYWPKQQSNLTLDAPIDRWDEAIPLGNGLLGALLWGSGNNLKVSLDRGDIWDLRDPGFDALQWNWQRMKELVSKGDADSLAETFEKPNSEKPYPTKISVGRIEFDLPQNICFQKFSLDLATAHSQVDGGMIEAFVSAVQPVCMIRFKGIKPSFRLMPSGADTNAAGDDGGLGRLATSLLGYPPPHYGRAEHTQWFLQQCAQDFSFAVIAGARDHGDCLEVAITIATSKDGADPLHVGRKIIEESLAVGYDAIFTEHKKWWDRFWSKSHIEIPDQNLQQHYDICQYFYGAASRQGCPPIPLQGVWTADEGSLPPWKGDYHNDLNTQLTYWAYLSANRLEQGLSFLDFMWSLLPQFRDFAKNFYNAPGGCIPGVMSLDGKAMGGWHQYAYSPTNGGWVAHSFYMHWRYTMDEIFLADRAYPFCKEIGIFTESLLEKDNNGRLKLPLSSSPEIHDNKLTAWLRPNSNYDLAIMRWLFPALNEMAERLGLHDERNRWNAVLDAFDNFAVDENDFTGRPCSGGVMLVAPGETSKESHRHHSHLLAIYPLGLITIENSQTDRDTIFNSIRQLDHFGMQFWVGYSFAWMACSGSRDADIMSGR